VYTISTVKSPKEYEAEDIAAGIDSISKVPIRESKNKK